MAETIQDAVCRETGLLDCRVHPRTWDLLRSTRMPTVRVVLGYLSSPTDAAVLESAAQRDALAGAIAEAIGQFCSPDASSPNR